MEPLASKLCSNTLMDVVAADRAITEGVAIASTPNALGEDDEACWVCSD